MFKPKQIVVWGFKNRYHTNGHVFYGFVRGFQHFGWKTYWLDDLSDLSGIDFANTLFISEHQAVRPPMPVRDDCFYLIHNLYGGSKSANELLKNANKAHFGVFTGRVYNDHGQAIPLDNGNMWCYPEKRVLDLLWATDLLPHEIYENIPDSCVFNDSSRVVNWVGSGRRTLNPFINACKANGIEFNFHSSSQGCLVSSEENVALIKTSRFSPIMVDDYQMTHPYYPCRLFKNISYGIYPLTNSKYVKEFTPWPVVFNEDSDRLFYDAQEQLPKQNIDVLHRMMNWIADRHTYANRASEIIRAVEIFNA